jgi:hypothetical protein
LKFLLAAFLLVSFAGLGCRSHPASVDITPPAAPRGIQTYAGDGFTEIFWIENTERDLAGYNVYVASNPQGSFRLIGSTRSPDFVDRVVVNGKTYYYGVSAYDFDGNEGVLSVDDFGATPRPEGYSVALFNYLASPNSSGYDFSTNSICPYNDKYSDIFFEYSNGVAYMNVWGDSDIQDMGFTTSLDDIREAPSGGWAPTKDVRLIVGHTYVVWTRDNHFAKFLVTSLSSQRAMFDWAYQVQEGNPFLKHTAQGRGDRGPLARNSASRHRS